MTSHVALLRGINVGGNKLVAMSDLRRFATDLGLDGARTLLQSGNLVFQAKAQSIARLERLLDTEAEKRLGLKTEFFVRTAKEWAALVASNPLPDEAARDPSHLLVMFLKQAPAAADVEALQHAITGGERVRADGRHAFIVYPDGMGRSRLTSALIEKKLGRGTARNWNTVLKIAALTAE